jgi:hypothetical protein
MPDPSRALTVLSRASALIVVLDAILSLDSAFTVLFLAIKMAVRA